MIISKTGLLDTNVLVCGQMRHLPITIQRIYPCGHIPFELFNLF